jgi:hypothetical protein
VSKRDAKDHIDLRNGSPTATGKLQRHVKRARYLSSSLIPTMINEPANTEKEARRRNQKYQDAVTQRFAAWRAGGGGCLVTNCAALSRHVR